MRLCIILASLLLSTQAYAATADSAILALDRPQYTRHIEEVDRRESLCLALNLYHEVRGSTLKDIHAVAWVTKNRVTKSKHKSYCKIIWESGQYTWTIKPVKSLIPKETKSWDRMVRVARQVINGDIADPTNGANTFYISRLGIPSWTEKGTGRMVIGAHTFVKLPKR